MKYLNGGRAFALGKIGELDDGIVKRLEENCPFSIDETSRAEIRESLKHCAIMMKSEQVRPNIKDMLSLLDELEKKTRSQLNLLQLIASGDTPAEQTLSVEFHVQYGLDVSELLNENHIVLQVIKTHREKVLENISHGFLPRESKRTERRGRNSSEAEEIFVRQFMAFYKRHGGNPAAHRQGSLENNDRDGPFVLFMKVINRLLPDEVRLAEGALITRIDRARYPRKKKSGKKV